MTDDELKTLRSEWASWQKACLEEDLPDSGEEAGEVVAAIDEALARGAEIDEWKLAVWAELRDYHQDANPHTTLLPEQVVNAFKDARSDAILATVGDEEFLAKVRQLSLRHCPRHYGKDGLPPHIWPDGEGTCGLSDLDKEMLSILDKAGL